MPLPCARLLQVCFSVIFLVASQWAGDCHAARYYVGTGGSDSRTGVQAQNRSTPWRNIRYAVNQAGAGDEVVVLNGTYNEEVYINRSGNASAELVLRAENREGARVVGLISATDQSYLKVEGFDVSNYRSSGLTKGVSFTRCHHITVRDNRVRECWGGGIAFDQSDWILVEWNITHDNAFFDPAQHSGISVYQPQYRGSDSRTYGVIIRNNTSFNNRNLVNNAALGRPSDGNGIVLDDFFNSQPGGNRVPYDRMSVVENNLCFNNGGNGIHCFQSQNIRIRNNTSVNNVSSFDFGGNVSVSECDRIYVYNNIFSSNNGRRAALQYNSRNYWFGFNIIDGAVREVPFDPSNYYGSPQFRFASFQPESFSRAVDSGLNVGDHFFLDVNGSQRIRRSIDRGAVELP